MTVDRNADANTVEALEPLADGSYGDPGIEDPVPVHVVLPTAPYGNDTSASANPDPNVVDQVEQAGSPPNETAEVAESSTPIDASLQDPLNGQPDIDRTSLKTRSLDLERRTGGRIDQGKGGEDHDPASSEGSSHAGDDSESPVSATRLPTLSAWSDQGTWQIGVVYAGTPVRIVGSLEDPVHLDGLPDGHSSVQPIDLLLDPEAPLVIFHVGRSTGEQSRRLAAGFNLVLVRSGGTFSAEGDGVQYERLFPSPLHGFEAFEVFVPVDAEVSASFGSDTYSISSAKGVPGFDLQGEVVVERYGRVCETFSGPPDLVSTNWSAVAFVVLGEDGIGSGKWRSSFVPEVRHGPIDLAPHLDGRSGGWYFARAYDEGGHLMDSLDFQYLCGLREVHVSNGDDGKDLDRTSFLVTAVHDAEVVIVPLHDQVAASFSAPNDSKLDQTSYEIDVLPAVNAVTLLASRTDASIRIDVPSPLTWWCVVEKGAEPEWSRAPILLRAADVLDASSTRTLTVKRAPADGNTERVLLAYGDASVRSWHLERWTRTDVAHVWLRNLGNLLTPETRGTFELRLVSNASGGASDYIRIGELRVAIACASCGREFETTDEVMKHLRTAHWEELAGEPTLKELQVIFPDKPIPWKILKCEYGGLDGCEGHYEPSHYDGDDAVGRIYEHVTHVHPGREHKFLVVTNLDEIREEFLAGLPKRIKCRLCPTYKGPAPTFTAGKSGEAQLMKHMIETHRDQLWTLK